MTGATEQQGETSHGSSAAMASVVVVGDAGYDILAFQEEGSHPEKSTFTHHPLETSHDVRVPSGAGFVYYALKGLFTPEFTVDYHAAGPKSLSPLPINLLTLKRNKQKNKYYKNPYRITQFEGLHQTPFPPFDHIITTDPATQQPARGLVGKHTSPNADAVAKREPEQVERTEGAAANNEAAEGAQRRPWLVLHDGGQWSGKDANADEFGQVLRAHDTALADWCSELSILVNVTRELPRLYALSADERLSHADELPQFRDVLWQKLCKRGHQVGIVVSLQTLRRAGASISRGLSVESAVEDLLAELHLYPPLRALGHFRHLFVTVGVIGLIHIERDKDKLCGRVYYNPFSNDPLLPRPDCFIGKNTVLIASLIRHLTQEDCLAPRGTSDAAAAVRQGILCALHANLDIHERGYDVEPIQSREDEPESDEPHNQYWTRKGIRVLRKLLNPAVEFLEKSEDEWCKFRHARRHAQEKRQEAIKLGANELPQTALPHAEDQRPQAPSESPAETMWAHADAIEGQAKQHLIEWLEQRDLNAKAKFACTALPPHLLQQPPRGHLRHPARWHMLDEMLGSAPVHRVNVAMAIVLGGHRRVFNRVWSAGAHERDIDDDNPQRRDDDRIWSVLTRGEFWNPQDRAPDYVTLEAGNLPALSERPLRTPEIIGDLAEFELNVPVVEFGKLTVAERDEIEGLRSIRNLLKNYLDNPGDKPISIAVFGPPGSGKSFGVKQIAEHLDPNIKILEFNMAQFRSPDDLGQALSRVSSENKGKAVPLAFFDEFDCALNGMQLGWLKYFLAPMQDGTFFGASQTINIGPAIFVFAGGIYSSFERFDPRSEPPDEEKGYQLTDDYKARIRAFAEQKGPDFISRLRGHMNVLQINAEPGSVKHLIRRAIQLRGLLSINGLLRPEDKDSGMAMVDLAIIYGLLTADDYRHGVRSLEATLRMCSRIDGYIEIASLPSRAQLNMHVDAEALHRRIHRGRSRTQRSGETLRHRLRRIMQALYELQEERLQLNAEELKDVLNRAERALRPQKEPRQT
ncbi:MAG: AAA family ATPase [Pseudomonadota bacterium]